MAPFLKHAVCGKLQRLKPCCKFDLQPRNFRLIILQFPVNFLQLFKWRPNYSYSHKDSWIGRPVIFVLNCAAIIWWPIVQVSISKLNIVGLESTLSALFRTRNLSSDNGGATSHADFHSQSFSCAFQFLKRIPTAFSKERAPHSFLKNNSLVLLWSH